LLAFAVSFDCFRMLRAVVRKIVGMSLAPLLLAVVGDLTIFRICFELASVIVSATPALALRSAADGLLWTVGETQKTTCSRSAAVLVIRLRDSFARRISENLIKRLLYCKLVFCVLPTVHNKPSAADRSANAGVALTITDASSKQIRNIVRSPTTARRSGARLIPTIFRTTARNIRKQSNETANASNGGTKSVASSGLKRTT